MSSLPPGMVTQGAPEQQSKTPMYIAGGVVLLLIVGLGLYFALRKPTAAPSTKKSSSAATTPTATTTPTPPPPAPEPEVFHVSQGGYTTTKSAAAAVCAQYGAEVATKAQLQNAAKNGADWCSTGWVADEDVAYYPAQTPRPGCLATGATPGLITYTPGDQAAVNCYGVKPNANEAKTGESIRSFNEVAGIYFQLRNTR